jgi:glycosyltransferase involved in cell wall biosynthesis
VGRRLTTTAVRRADFLTAPSQPLLDAAASMGLVAGRGHHLLWGVDTGRFHPDVDGRGVRRRLEVPDDVPLVLSPRRMEPLYRIADIVDAWERERSSGRRSVLALASDGGSLEPHLRERVAVSDRKEDLRILPALDYGDMPALFAAADVVVSVPESDGTPMSVLEALATGTPVIASDLPSLRPWVMEGRTGLRVPVGDVGALAVALGRLVGDRALRERMAEEAARHAASEADQAVWMDRAVALYREVTGREGTA